MENASKALIMAAGTLIGMLVISLAVYLFTSFGAVSAQLHQQKAAQHLENFNSQFTSYEGKEGITIYDVVSVANLATESNRYYSYSTRTLNTVNGKDSYIQVILRNGTIGYGGVGQPIEKGSNTKTEDITTFYNALISKALINDMVTKTDTKPDGTIIRTYQAPREYTCTVNISQETGRVWRVEFIAK